MCSSQTHEPTPRLGAGSATTKGSPDEHTTRAQDRARYRSHQQHRPRDRDRVRRRRGARHRQRTQPRARRRGCRADPRGWRACRIHRRGPQRLRAGVPSPRCRRHAGARRTDRRAVNSAGIFPGSTTPTVDEAMFDEVYAVNVKAPFFLIAAIAPEMTARGSGSIINLGSWVARLGSPVGALYASTKGAMETLTRAWAAEFGSPGVRVNAISPGVVRTPIENDPAAAMMNGTPYGAFGSPDAIAHAAVYLASDESQFVNGTVIDVDGGRVNVAVIAAG